MERVAAPSPSADIPRHHESSLQTRRSEDAFIAQSLDDVSAGIAVLGRRAPSFVGGHLMRGQRRRSDRKRLPRRRYFPGDIALRDWAFFDGKHGLAGVAVQDIQHSGLVALDCDWNILSIVA